MLEVANNEGRFVPGPDDRNGEVALDELLEQRDSTRVPLNRYVISLSALVQRYPDFIDGHAHLGFALMEQGKSKLALEACERGFRIGEANIPAKFKGKIEWGWLENRPFLRAAQGVALCHQRLGQHQQTIQMMRKLLKWNPNDNQGIRYLIGSEYLRNGDTTKAEKVILKELGYFPPYQYEAALMEIAAGRLVEAATRLRQAFIANGYIAEMLCGSYNPLKLAIWHGSNLAEPEVAQKYIECYGKLWQQTPIAIPFLRWVHTHPKVAGERSSVLEIREALLWEHDFEARRALGDEEERRVAQIDDRLSIEIVRKRPDRYNRLVEPWLYTTFN